MLTMLLLATAVAWLTAIAVVAGLCLSAARGDRALPRVAAVRRPECRARLRPVA